MIKLLLGRALPLGMAGLLLHSTYSPLEPALNAFRAATAALAGESVADSGAGALATGTAQNQLDQIIARVKSSGGGGQVAPAPTVGAAPGRPAIARPNGPIRLIPPIGRNPQPVRR